MKRRRSKQRERHGGRRLAAALRAVVLAPIVAYQRFVSPALPARCKYHPSCSQYAIEAVRELGAARGTLLALWRLARCNPWSHGGVDEVAERRFFRSRPAERAGSGESASSRPGAFEPGPAA